MRIGEYASGGISTRHQTLQERPKPLISPAVPTGVVNDAQQIEIEALLRLGTRQVWLNQRTRWFKGWLQTWLVMMRAPGKLVREMGVGSFLVFQVLIGGMLVASLTHPWMVMLVITTAGYMMLGFPETATLDALLFLIDVANMLGSYIILLVLGRRAMLRDEKRKVGWRWIALPVYWMMISGAAWRALFQLHFKPFFWDKTPHLPTAPPTAIRPTPAPAQ